MTTTEPAPIDPDVRRQLRRIAFVLTGQFPAILVPHNAMTAPKIDEALDKNGVSVADVLDAMANDVEKIAAGNQEMHRRSHEREQELTNELRDVEAVRRVFGLDKLAENVVAALTAEIEGQA